MYSRIILYRILPGLLCCWISIAALASPISWTLNRGWLTASEENTALLTAAEEPAVTLNIDQTVFPSTISPVIQNREDALEAHYIGDNGELIDRYIPFPALGPDAWLRTLTYTNRSNTSQDITAARMRLAPIRLPNGATWFPQWFWMGEVAQGRAVCLSYRGADDFYRINDREKYIEHTVDACWRLAPGQQAMIGSQGIWLGKAGRDAFRSEAQRWYSAIDLHIPADTPPWLYDAILYECSAGGHIDSRFSDVGGFDALDHQVDYLAGLGVTAIWLQAIHKHKTPPDPVHGGWNFYDPLDVLAVDSILGGPEALKRLTADFQHHNVQVIGELVPHGGHSVQAMALPQWWTSGRNGKPLRNWGGCGMDYSSPEWQGVMRDESAWLARDFGMTGVRIDVADGSGANWSSPRTNHASFSTLGGSLEMLRAIRDGFRKEGIAPFILPENGNSPEHFAVTPVAYGHSTWMMFARELPALKANPVQMVKRVRDFFETERGSLPPGSRILRTLNNHDTVCETGRVQYRYGAGLARALYGVCLMVEGIPMLYQEEETGSYDALRALNLARRNVPEFAHGVPDYTAIQFAPEVFTCLRTALDSHAIGLSNLSGKTCSGKVTLPMSIPDGTPVFDAVSGLQTPISRNAFRWTLPPYATALLRIGTPPLSSTAPPMLPAPTNSDSDPRAAFETTPHAVRIQWGSMSGTIQAGTDTITTRKKGNTLEVDIQSQSETPEITISNADTWKVSGQTALLSDRVIRRHYPFPPQTQYAWDRTLSWISIPLYNSIAPTGRLWESMLEPLHPKRPAIAFESGKQAILLTDIQTRSGNIVLTDRTDEMNPEPYGLTLRFYHTDPDLTPNVRAFGLGQPWERDATPKQTESPHTVRFTLTLTTTPEADDALQAKRQPIARGEAQVQYQGNRFHHEGNTHWFIEPGTMVWTRLVPVPGKHRLRLELRHSEVAPEGTDLDNAYTLRINGKIVPLEWVQRNTFNKGNAFFGYALTPPLDLATIQNLSIEAQKSWCAQRGALHLIPERSTGN